MTHTDPDLPLNTWVIATQFGIKATAQTKREASILQDWEADLLNTCFVLHQKLIKKNNN